MKVSIITVCFNSERTILDTIESVAMQDYPDIEYIVIDGMSTDNTAKMIRQRMDVVDVFVREQDEGLWDAMNKGVAMSKGDYFCFINSDDFFVHSNVITRLVNRLTQEGADAVFGYVDIVDPVITAKIIRRYRIAHCNKTLFRLGMMPAHPGLLCKRSLFEEHGGFVLDDKLPQDFELLVRYLAKGNMKAKLLPEVIVKMRNGGVSNRSFLDRIKRIEALVASCRINGIWTSALVVPFKYPFKLFEYVRR